MNAVCERTELVTAACTSCRPLRTRSTSSVATGSSRGAPGSLEGERHEPLLRSVVDVALDSPPFVVGGRREPAA